MIKVKENKKNNITGFTMVSILLFISFVLFQTAISQGVSEISYITEEQDKKYGDKVKLKCSVDNLANITLLWIKIEHPNDSLILTHGYIVNYHGFSIYYDEIEKTSILQINNFQKYHEGTYRCVLITSSGNHIKAEVQLHHEESARIVSITSSPFETPLGKIITLHCDAEGFPRPEIFWTREGNRIFADGTMIYKNKNLTIPGIIELDEGMYFCHAGNGVGASDIRNVSITIILPPSVAAIHSKLGLTINSTAKLTCRVKNFPLSNVIWEKDGKRLNFSEHQYYQSVSTLYKNKCIYWELEFLITDKNQFGTYTCIATNDLGKSTDAIFLYEDRSGPSYSSIPSNDACE